MSKDFSLKALIVPRYKVPTTCVVCCTNEPKNVVFMGIVPTYAVPTYVVPSYIAPT